MNYYTTDQIDDLASRIRTSFDVPDDKYEVDIYRLATDIGFDVYEVNFSSDDIAGTFEKEKGEKGQIYINRKDMYERKRFTVAHEVAHGILHVRKDTDEKHTDYRQPLKYYANKDDLKKEIQANMLAAALLMPRKLFTDAWKEREDIDDIADLFSVSKRAATIRLDALGLL